MPLTIPQRCAMWKKLHCVSGENARSSTSGFVRDMEWTSLRCNSSNENSKKKSASWCATSALSARRRCELCWWNQDDWERWNDRALSVVQVMCVPSLESVMWRPDAAVPCERLADGCKFMDRYSTSYTRKTCGDGSCSAQAARTCGPAGARSTVRQSCSCDSGHSSLAGARPESTSNVRAVGKRDMCGKTDTYGI